MAAPAPTTFQPWKIRRGNLGLALMGLAAVYKPSLPWIFHLVNRISPFGDHHHTGLARTLVAQSDTGLGQGRIDNMILNTEVHVTLGVLVLVTLTLSAGWLARLAFASRPLDTVGRLLVTITQVVLAVQVLAGIKLLDQGQGTHQLYIHYIGGLIPLGIFLLGGWWVRGDSTRSNQILAVLVALGWVSAVMAFVIGRAYVNA